MQIMPSTGEWSAGKLDDAFDVQRLYEPSVNLRYDAAGICAFCSIATMATCARPRPPIIRGRARVDEWLQDPEYSQDGRTTHGDLLRRHRDTYVSRIMESYEHYKELY